MGAKKQIQEEHKLLAQNENICCNAQIDEINKDIDALYSSCKDSGLSDEQIRICAAPILSLIQKAYWRRLCRRFSFFIAVLLLLLALYYYESSFRFCRAIFRLVLIQVNTQLCNVKNNCLKCLNFIIILTRYLKFVLFKINIYNAIIK